ncbi:MAG TPA: M23 family metallopeptidase [Chitinophagaceae bacterium]|nr:M23 family metallopeptidase [Chitinophagaceae bacterium]
MRTGFIVGFILICLLGRAQTKMYPKGYFRNPLNIPMELVANFGELRANHWHMGLDIRTQQRENLPVHAAAEGFVSRIKIEPGGFGRAISIQHPNGYTTLYAHLNNFEPRLEQWVVEQQYRLSSWSVELTVPSNLFPVAKGDFIAYSGNTGGSQGPHVHFEIRDTKSEACLNPLLFGMPIVDGVPPTLLRLAMYDRSKSVYDQSPQLLAVKKVNGGYALARSGLLKVGSNKISFAIGAIDRFTGSGNGNGIYSSSISMDGVLQSQFILDDISYDETRYLNAQIDYRYKYNGGAYVQHLSRMPGDFSQAYTRTASDGVLYLNDTFVHTVKIEIRDAAQNLSTLQFSVQFDEKLYKPVISTAITKFIPGNINIYEAPFFEAFASEYAVYDTAKVTYTTAATINEKAVSGIHTFLGPSIPIHDMLTVRVKPEITVPANVKDKVVLFSTSGTRKAVQKAKWSGNWVWGLFRQFGTYQALIDDVPPTINAPGYGDTIDLRKATRIVFSPKDNLNEVANFKATVDGQWLRFTNDKGYSYIYRFDDKFTPGVHQLEVSIEDVAGNKITKSWYVRR